MRHCGLNNMGGAGGVTQHHLTLDSHPTAGQTRYSGLEMIGSVPWGTHFCQFYQAKKDLADILVPYFKAGLESNEFCMWVTSADLSQAEAEAALAEAVPKFKQYVQKGQIEILPYTEWYLKEGIFELERVLKGWVEKMEHGLAQGFDGLRLTGNTVWLEKKDWQNFAEYEAAVDHVLGQYRMIALCTYSLKKCGGMEILDVVRNHQFAVIKGEKGWDLVETSARHREHLEELVKERTGQVQAANAQLRASNEELERFNRAMVGRELRMVELKKEVNALCAQCGQPPRYALDFEQEQPPP